MFGINRDLSRELVKCELVNLCKYVLKDENDIVKFVDLSLFKMNRSKSNPISSMKVLENDIFTLLRENNCSDSIIAEVRGHIRRLDNMNNERFVRILQFLTKVSKLGSTNNIGSFKRNPMDTSFINTSIKTVDNRSRNNLNTNNSALDMNGPSPTNFFDNNNELSEHLVIGDVLFISMGVTGHYFNWNSTRNTLEIFENPQQLVLSQSMFIPVCKLVQNGVLYNKIRQFVGKGNRLEYTGVVYQGLCTALNNHLQAYIHMVSDLHSQYQLWTNELSQNRSGSLSTQHQMTLQQLIFTFHDPGRILQFLVGLIDDCSEKKGGQLASTIYSFIPCGDPQRDKLVKNLLLSSVEPFFEFIRQWIYDGVLEEHQEFFVALNTNYSNKLQWTEKYGLRKQLIPSFITESQAKRILLTGKSINFLREVCKVQSSLRTNSNISKTMTCTAESMINQDIDRQFENMINTVYHETSKYLLNVMVKNFRLMDHFMALRKFMLHGQGDFILRLIDLIAPQLNERCDNLQSSSLQGQLIEAIRTTNAQYSPSDIVNRVSINLLKMGQYESGWDIFALRYDFHDVRPLFALLSQHNFQCYTRAFIHLFRSRRVHFILNNLFKRQNNCRRLYTGALKQEIQPLLIFNNKLIMEKLHFVNQIQYYINFEVLECSWKKFMENLSRAEDFDAVLNYHSCFLSQVTSRCMLEETSRDLLTNLRTIFDLVIGFEELQDLMYHKFNEELYKRQQFLRQKENTNPNQEWIGTSDVEQQEYKRQRIFVEQHLVSFKQKLRAHHQQYESQVVQFIATLSNQSDSSLRCLATSLDFNGQYHSLVKEIRQIQMASN